MAINTREMSRFSLAQIHRAVASGLKSGDNFRGPLLSGGGGGGAPAISKASLKRHSEQLTATAARRHESLSFSRVAH